MCTETRTGIAGFLCMCVCICLRTMCCPGTTSDVYACQMFRAGDASSNIPSGLSSRRAVLPNPSSCAVHYASGDGHDTDYMQIEPYIVDQNVDYWSNFGHDTDYMQIEPYVVA